jgi:uncharacterized damage-inducible protein DinB
VSTVAANKPESNEFAPYYSKYISLVRDGDVVSTLRQQLDNSLSLLRGISEEKANSRYAPDKWSVKEVVGHVLDTERIFGYRALRFARNDQTPLNGFEQDDYVRAANFGKIRLSDLADEFQNVRQANIHLFRSLDDAAWLRRGAANENEVSVRALAYIIAGHELHHMGILKTKYLQS